jgi:hypothetical protein
LKVKICFLDYLRFARSAGLNQSIYQGMEAQE